jgi:hypothetical protein
LIHPSTMSSSNSTCENCCGYTGRFVKAIELSACVRAKGTNAIF